MEIKKIINNKLKNIENLINENKKKFERGEPFPHIIIENFFDEEFLNEVLNEFLIFPNKKKQQIIQIKMK